MRMPFSGFFSAVFASMPCVSDLVAHETASSCHRRRVAVMNSLRGASVIDAILQTLRFSPQLFAGASARRGSLLPLSNVELLSMCSLQLCKDEVHCSSHELPKTFAENAILFLQVLLQRPNATASLRH